MAIGQMRVSMSIWPRVQANAEAAAAPVPRSAEGTAAASSSSSRPAPEELEGRSEPAFAGV
eukprot:9603204-Alexandrium_andersonii.AAC.1